MKQAQSNPLARELSREEMPDAHPFDDVLTAFAENTLLERERLEVVEHLSRCGSCREVLSLATAAVPEALAAVKPLVLLSRRRSRAWLPWAVAATGLVVVSSALLLYQWGAQLGDGLGVPTLLRQPGKRHRRQECKDLREQRVVRANNSHRFHLPYRNRLRSLQDWPTVPAFASIGESMKLGRWRVPLTV